MHHLGDQGEWNAASPPASRNRRARGEQQQERADALSAGAEQVGGGARQLARGSPGRGQQQALEARNPFRRLRRRQQLCRGRARERARRRLVKLRQTPR